MLIGTCRFSVYTCLAGDVCHLTVHGLGRWLTAVVELVIFQVEKKIEATQCFFMFIVNIRVSVRPST